MTMNENVLMMTAAKGERGKANLVFTKVRSADNGYWTYMLTGRGTTAISRAVGHIQSKSPRNGAPVVVLIGLSAELANRTLDLMRPNDEELLDCHLRTRFVAARR
jgi:hypothetical protein